MSNIPYPDVPPLPGVPPISRLASQGIAVGLAVAAELYALYLKIKNTPPVYPKQKDLYSTWGILYESNNTSTVSYTSTTPTATIITSPFSTPTTILTTNTATRTVEFKGTLALQPDSFVKFEYKESHKISNYPVEQGSFQSYNKITLPYEIKLIVTKNGASNIGPFINQILLLLNSTKILSVVTPDKTFMSANLINFDYKKEARNGAVLLIAELTFQEVRIAPNPAAPVAAPQADQTFAIGQVSPLPEMTPKRTTLPTNEFLVN